MKPAHLTVIRAFAIFAIIAVPVTLLAWQQKDQHSIPPQKEKTDTIPTKKEPRERKIVDLDEVLDDMDRVDIELDLKDLDIELAKIGPEIERKLAKAKIEIDKAVKEINLAEINEEINASLKEIDFDAINEEVKESLEKIDWDEMHEEINKAKEISLDELKEELTKVETEMKNIKPELEKELAKAKKEVEKAKAELKEYKSFVDGLEADGLINKKDEYSIKHKNGALIINGKIQSTETYNKYRSFLEKHKTLTIEKSVDNFNIDHDNDND